MKSLVLLLAAAAALCLCAGTARASDAVTVPDVGGLIWSDAVSQLQGVGLTARSAGDGVVVPQASTVADQCPRAGDTVPPGATITLSVRTVIADCATVGYSSGTGSGGGGGDSTCDPAVSRCTLGAGPVRPLILIPGTLGSIIKLDGDTVWPPDPVQLALSPSDHFLDALAFNDDGDGNGGPTHDGGISGLIGATRVLCAALAGCAITIHHYDDTVSKLEGMGYKLDESLFTFPYDWRLGMAANAERLHARIQEVLAATHAGSVDILAHSQGGLVTNFYLHAYLGADVHRVVTVGTPYLGAPKFLGILQYKEPCEFDFGTCLLNRNEASKLVHNFPGALELLPSARYWDVAASPLVFRTVLSHSNTRVVATYPEMLARLDAGGQNMNLIRSAGGAHVVADEFPASSTPILRVAGIRKWTIGTIEEEQYQTCWHDGHALVPCQFVTTIKNHMVSGDGTVPAPSAELRNCRTGANLDTSSNAFTAQRAGVSHDDLIRDDAVLAWANVFFRSGAAVPGCGPGTLRRLSSTDDDSISGTLLHTSGPLTGSIDDGTSTTGTTEGSSGFAAEDIPGSAYFPADDGADYAVSGDGSFTGTFTATESGTVSLQMSTYDGGSVTGSAVSPPVDVAAGAVVHLSYAQPQDLGLLQVTIDDDGDGTIDRTVPFEQPLAGDAVDDATPPTTTVTVTHFVDQGQKLVRVVVDAADDGGAGIGDVTWRTTTGLHGTYTGPLVLPAAGDLSAVATDRAGNVQVTPSWGVLDDHAGLPYLVTSFATRIDGVGRIDYAGDIDEWGIHSDGAPLEVALVDHPNAVTLELDDTDGNVLATAAPRSHNTLALDAEVPPGDYLVKVAGDEPTKRPYVLRAG